MRSLDDAIKALKKLNADLAIIDKLSRGAIDETVQNRYWRHGPEHRHARSFQDKTYDLRKQINNLGDFGDTEKVRYACWMAFLKENGIRLD